MNDAPQTMPMPPTSPSAVEAIGLADPGVLLRSGELFAELSDGERNELLEAAERLTCQAGENLIRRGEEGCLYLVLAGKARLVDASQGRQPLILDTRGHGDYLGEESLFDGYGFPATIQAVEDLQLLRLPGPLLRTLMAAHPSLRERLRRRFLHELELHFLRTLKLFASLTLRDSERLLESVERVALTAGETLFRKGDPADAAYIVRSGEMEIFRDGDREEVISVLHAGDLLGEIALQSGSPRSAGARARSDSVLLLLHRDVYDWVAAAGQVGDAVSRESERRLLRDDFLEYRADTEQGRRAILELLSQPSGVERLWQLARHEKQHPEQTLRMLGQACGMPHLPPTPNLLVDPELVRQLPAGYLQANQLLPVSLDDGRVEVLTASPYLGTVLNELADRLDAAVVPRITEPEFLAKLIESSTSGHDEGGLAGLGDEEGWDTLDSIEDLKDQAQAAPIIKLVNNLFMEAIARKASDIHIDPYEEGLEFRYRIDGILHPVSSVSRRIQPAIVSRIKIMANLDIAERRIPQDGRISLRLESRSYDIRVASIPTVFGEGVVMRILDKSSVQVAIEDVGFAPAMLETWKRTVTRPNGVVLVTGPTGSGKTTTLYATLNHIKRPELKIITAEDPVEYQMHGIKQIQVNPKVDLTFAAALRSMLRLDPDIVMVGEIRDMETAEIAVQAALTGHLVFSTLHTNDAPTAVTRLVEMGIAPYLVASSLNASLAQRLVRKLCGNCREQDAEGRWHAVGCGACGGTGYKGRLGIYELMLVDDPLRRQIIDNRDASELAATARRAGMGSLWEDGMAKAAQGLTTEEEVRRVAG